MRNDLEVKIYCKTCGQRAYNVIPLERDKGFEYYCDRHAGGNNSEDRLRREILEGKHG